MRYYAIIEIGEGWNQIWKSFTSLEDAKKEMASLDSQMRDAACFEPGYQLAKGMAEIRDLVPQFSESEIKAEWFTKAII